MSKKVDESQQKGDANDKIQNSSKAAQERSVSSTMKITKHQSLDGQEESVDPRVQVELEKLNTATDLINKLEIELDEARANFRLLLTESSQRINQLAVKLGTCIDKARPYYEARMKAKELQQETQKAALRFERASSAHVAAKEMVRLSEEGLCAEGRTFDPAWQEMLNHATMKVNEAEQERRLSKALHQKSSQAYNEAEQSVQQLHMLFKKSIVKSRPYFEMKAQFNQLLEEQKRRVHHLEEHVMQVKMGYSEALHNLERISDEIHRRRKKKEEEKMLSLEQRTDGVGAEDPPPQFNGTVGQHFGPSSAPPTYSAAVNQEATNPFQDATKAADTRALPVMPLNLVSQRASLAEMEEMTPMTPQTPMKPLSVDVSKGAKSASLTYDDFKCIDLGDNLSSDKEDDKPSLSPTDSSGFKPASPMHRSLHLDSSTVRVDGGTPLRNPNFDPLRVPRGDEVSDTESLASTDTADTLDDHQIECLLLDRVLELDYQDLLTSTSDIVSTP